VDWFDQVIARPVILIGRNLYIMSKLNNNLAHSIISHENHKKGNDAIHNIQVNKKKNY
jgi:hypothetical protein